MTEHTSPLLVANNLTRHYRVSRGLFKGHATVKALNGVSFSLQRGKTLAVVGESGCGKSTLARQLTLIEPPTAGALQIDGVDVAKADAATSFGPQVKWALPLNDVLSIGAVASAKFSSQAPRYANSTLVLPLTWRATDALSAHVNWGRNFLRGGVGQPRGSVSLEWLPISDLSLVAERFREAANNSTRLGARYALTSDVKLDISRASSLHAGGVSWLTASVIWEFDR